MPASNGGTSAPLNLFLIPVTDNTHIINVNGLMFTFDTTNFNSVLEPSFYNYKVEEIIAGRTPSCTRQIITYRDLGVATITCTLSGYDQNQQATVSNPETFAIGTVGASGKLCSIVRGLSLTAQNLQYNITRQANAGPVSIIKVRLEGRVEASAYA
jgi:hypothetical protein